MLSILMTIGLLFVGPIPSQDDYANLRQAGLAEFEFGHGPKLSLHAVKPSLPYART
jgi:hypothetical protein